MRIKKSWIIVVVVIVAAFILYKVISGDKKSNQETQRIISPFIGNIQVVITTTATVLPENRLEIKAPVNGRVDKILVKEGQKVKSGQIVAWMSSTDRAALLDAARGEGEAEYKKWQDTYRPIPLMAPIDGEVIVATTQPGQTVITVDPIVVLSDHLIVRAQVDETDIGKIKLDQEAIITLDAYPDSKIKATVRHLYYESKVLNNVTVYEVDLLPQEIPAFFRSGMNASVDFIIQKKDNILQLPVVAIHKKDSESFVWLNAKDQSKPIRQVIQTGVSDEKNIEIVSGLKEDDEVILKEKKISLDQKDKGKNPFMPSRPSGGNRNNSR